MKRKNRVIINSLLIIHLLSLHAGTQLFSQNKPVHGTDLNSKSNETVWISDNGDGTYKNPVIYADYSDPDVVRVGDDYYMTSSSFSNFPGLPILHSKDLVNWTIIGHAAVKYPSDSFNKPQHGNGIWAPSIRFHKGEFYIYYGDPDYGIFMTKSVNPAGPWEPLHLVRKAKGWIDPSPLWDEDGNNYLVHAWARSRSGIKHIITINKLSADGRTILDEGVNVFSDSLTQSTIEGPKFYKRNGYYYIFAPAGGVKPGWQTVLRSKNIYGPYEAKVVLEQGTTNINGPHQGGWVQTQKGEDWFLHFQDRYTYGRIVHLQPMHWEKDWPVMGEDFDGNGIGEPVANHKKPDVGKVYPVSVPQTDDDFNSDKLSLQWQWEANFSSGWFSLTARNGWLRLFSQPQYEDTQNLWTIPSIVSQKFPAPEFSVTAKLEFKPYCTGEKAGVIILGMDYSYIAIEKSDEGYKILQKNCVDAEKGTEEELIARSDYQMDNVFLKVDVKPEVVTNVNPKLFCYFSFSSDGKMYKSFGKAFLAKAGKWIGAKIGIFSSSPAGSNNAGFADFDWFKFSR